MNHSGRLHWNHRAKVENFMFLPTFARKLINWLEGIILVRILFVLELKGTALQFVAIKAMERGNTTECTMYIDYTRFHLISFTSYTNIMYEHYTFCTHQRLCILCGSISYNWVGLVAGWGPWFVYRAHSTTAIIGPTFFHTLPYYPWIFGFHIFLYFA